MSKPIKNIQNASHADLIDMARGLMDQLQLQSESFQLQGAEVTELRAEKASLAQALTETQQALAKTEQTLTQTEQALAKTQQELKDAQEELRETKRSKAPFSKGPRKANPKKPGRKAGVGPFTRRPAPVATDSDEVIKVDVPLTADQQSCPNCDVPLEVEIEEASKIDIPVVPKRKITLFRQEVGTCPICGLKRRGEHPDLPADQCGATAHRVSEQALAQCFAMHYNSGLPVCKVPALFRQMSGISITQSALTQAAIKLTQPEAVLGKVYHTLRDEVRESDVVNTDDTGWRIGALLAFLMGFFATWTVVFQVRKFHRHQEVLEVIGKDFAGLLGTDRGPSYESLTMVGMLIQKCLSHLIKNLRTVEEKKTGEVRKFSTDLIATLREALDHWNEYQQSESKDLEAYRKRGEEINKSLDKQLAPREMEDTDNQRMLDGIGKQHDQGRVTLFLIHPEIEPTNNRAERGLRPAVIARKVSQCSKNEDGAQATAVIKSIFETLKLRVPPGPNHEQRVVDAFADILRGKPMPPIPVL